MEIRETDVNNGGAVEKGGNKGGGGEKTFREGPAGHYRDQGGDPRKLSTAATLESCNAEKIERSVSNRERQRRANAAHGWEQRKADEYLGRRDRETTRQEQTQKSK